MIWRFEALEHSGFQGTVLGTLIMPYCSGLSNLIFAFIMIRTPGNGTLVIENSMVNNVTNLTILLGLPALIWGLDVFPNGKNKKQPGRRADSYRINRLSLLLSLTALVFFTGLLWALTRDGLLDFNDGVVLIGVFLFWQVFHVFDVLKENVRKNRSFSWWLPVDFSIIIGAGYVIYISIERLVSWMPDHGAGILNFNMIGWLSGLLMVLPNALLAFYYAARNRAEIVYSSQIGDGHICIPLCIGFSALFYPIRVPAFFDTGIYILLGAAGFHFICLVVLRRLPRLPGLVLTAVYVFFLFKGFFPLMS
jgi:cation:H+ antiporter